VIPPWNFATTVEPQAGRGFRRWLGAPQASAASDAGADSGLRRQLGWAAPAGAAIAGLAAVAGWALAERPTAFGALVVGATLATAALLFRGFTTRVLERLDDELGERQTLRAALSATHKTKEEFRTLAYHDELTGLPNRSLLYDRVGVAITHARREATRVALLFLDLDDFKAVNDSFGHGFGDRLLVELAGRVRGSVRAGDTVARFGGDEFVVLLGAVSGAADAAQVATKVLEAVRAPFRLDGNEVTVAASVGMSLFPDDGASCDELLSQADAAMYRDKQDGARHDPAVASAEQEARGGDYETRGMN